MTYPRKDNAHGEVGVNVVGGEASTNQSRHAQSSIDADILRSKSTSREAQKAKLIVLLRSGPKTTIELRDQGLMMPAARVFDLKSDGYVITSTLLPLYDSNGFRHAKCAKYSLISEPEQQGGAV